MSDSDTSGFAKFVPGFEFLQNLAKGAGGSAATLPGMGHWVAPTLDVEELDKRIGELKNVQFWLEQNSRALSATIQALEVQKMTLATLKGMNFNLGEMTRAFGLGAQEHPAPDAASPTPRPAPTGSVPPDAADNPASTGEGSDPPKLVDPLKLWGSLAQQFQHVAAGVMQQVAAGAAAGAQPDKASPKTRKRTGAAAQKPAAKKPPRP